MHSKLAHSSFFEAYITEGISGSHLKTASGPDQSCVLDMP
jgi:hypothetical protein